MDRIKRLTLLLLFLFFSFSLVVIFRSFLMFYIIEPIALVFWVFWRIVWSIDQNIYWSVLVVIYTILFIRMIPYWKDTYHISAYDYTEESINRVEYWKTVIEDDGLGMKKSDQLNDSINELLMSVINEEKQYESKDLETMIAGRKMSFPPQASSYLYPSKDKHRLYPTNHRRSIISLMPRWIRSRVRKYIHQDYSSVDEILTWMENELEINND